MHGPPLIGWLLVALCAATGTYCLLQTRGEPPGPGRRVARAEALMGWGMAAMAVPSAVLDPRPWGPLAFAAVFGVAAVRAVGHHHLHHAIGALAMAYMAFAMMTGRPGAPGGHGHDASMAAGGDMASNATAGGIPVLTGALLAYFAVYAVRSGLRLLPMTDGAVTAAGAGAPYVGWSRRPELRHACRLTMAIGMFVMLLTL
ncbi:putative integral membrane protein [Streptomyces himastatinicus ATCC 53653]|uniref:Putative integral membrane protein n=1 Tax=Streptomyces himastatinicus ATCC 53653 TaxID=457427 RepID=D9WLE4_9ACTN|nr:DUF5134 domain-containing protein [Streptomyces himastatinicus]EFL21547.1 putative integral membrane protein [Streptomyces himastatinicus ATCC 53653]